MYGPLYRRVLQPTFERVVKRRRTLEYWDLAEKRQWWSRERLEAFQLNALRNLLVHAFETCPYSRETWESQRLAPRGLTSLEEFREWPLLTRWGATNSWAAAVRAQNQWTFLPMSSKTSKTRSGPSSTKRWRLVSTCVW